MPFWRIYYHLVWGTKNREPTIDEVREETIRRSLRATSTQHQALVHAIGVMPDHVHFAVSLPPTGTVATLMRDLKGSSSHLINHPDRHPVSLQEFAWQAEYGVVSFGEASLSTIVAYVENQRRHHADQQLIQIYEQLERPFIKPPCRN